MEPLAIKHSISVTDSIKNEAQNSETIVVTRCLSEKCTGFYTDSLSESILVRCLDPKHNIENGAGNHPTPTVQQSQTIPFPKRLENENR